MTPPFGPEELGFIRSLLDDRDDLLTWLSYADWLEEHGFPERAEFLRLSVEHRQAEPGSRHAAQIGQRLLDLRRSLDAQWMMIFDDPAVDNCPASHGWAFRCPKSWYTLAPTDRPDIRICHDCQSPVFYCHTVDEARLFAAAGQCVALSSRSEERLDGDAETIFVGAMLPLASLGRGHRVRPGPRHRRVDTRGGSTGGPTETR